MDIVFRPLIENENLINELPPEAHIFLDEMRSYITLRLSVLAEEINNEELVNPTDKGATCIMVSFNPNGINFWGYSVDLRNKMKACFDATNIDRDIQLLWAKFDVRVMALLN